MSGHRSRTSCCRRTCVRLRADGGSRRRSCGRRRHPAVRPGGARLVRRGRWTRWASTRRGYRRRTRDRRSPGLSRPRPRTRPVCGRARRWWRAEATKRRPRSAWERSSPEWCRSRSAHRGSCSPRPTNRCIDPEGRLHSFCHAVPDRWHVMGVMLSAAGSLQWFRDALAPGVAFPALVDEGARRAAGQRRRAVSAVPVGGADPVSGPARPRGRSSGSRRATAGRT